MDINKLVLSQYIKSHPITSAKKYMRRNYFLTLQYLVASTEQQDLWSNKVMELYRRQWNQSDKTEPYKSVGFITRMITGKYKFNLLLDALFISAFSDRKIGENLVDKFLLIYGKKYSEKVNMILSVFYNGYEDFLKTKIKELDKVFPILCKNRDFYNRIAKKVIITANMSAGKSTLLNALVGKNINKVQNMACTAKVHYIYNKSNEDDLIYEWDHNLELDATYEILMDDNHNNETSEIHVGTRFRSIFDVDEKVCFIDTPGVNFSMDESHKEIANTAIQTMECDLLIYLLNGENLCTEDDLEHLEFVHKNYKGPIIFLVNKMDTYRKGDDSISDTIKKVTSFLSEIGYADPKVYPISAYAAQLGKQAIFEGIEDEEEQDSLNTFHRKLKKPEFSYYAYYPVEVDISEYENREEYELLKNSGILHLEKMIYG